MDVLQVYLWFLRFLKVQWDAESSAFRPLLCGTSSQLGFDLKLFFFHKASSSVWFR